jgi:hypothetical protein
MPSGRDLTAITSNVVYDSMMKEVIDFGSALRNAAPEDARRWGVRMLTIWSKLGNDESQFAAVETETPRKLMCLNLPEK